VIYDFVCLPKWRIKIYIYYRVTQKFVHRFLT